MIAVVTNSDAISVSCLPITQRDCPDIPYQPRIPAAEALATSRLAAGSGGWSESSCSRPTREEGEEERESRAVELSSVTVWRH